MVPDVDNLKGGGTRCVLGYINPISTYYVGIELVLVMYRYFTHIAMCQYYCNNVNTVAQ